MPLPALLGVADGGGALDSGLPGGSAGSLPSGSCRLVCVSVSKCEHGFAPAKALMRDTRKQTVSLTLSCSSTETEHEAGKAVRSTWTWGKADDGCVTAPAGGLLPARSGCDLHQQLRVRPQRVFPSGSYLQCLEAVSICVKVRSAPIPVISCHMRTRQRRQPVAEAAGPQRRPPSL